MEFNREKYLSNIHEKLYILGDKVETFSSLNILRIPPCYFRSGM